METQKGFSRMKKKNLNITEKWVLLIMVLNVSWWENTFDCFQPRQTSRPWIKTMFRDNHSLLKSTFEFPAHLPTLWLPQLLTAQYTQHFPSPIALTSIWTSFPAHNLAPLPWFWQLPLGLPPKMIAAYIPQLPTHVYSTHSFISL